MEVTSVNWLYLFTLGIIIVALIAALIAAVLTQTRRNRRDR